MPVLEWVAELTVATVIEGVPTRLEAFDEFDAAVANDAVPVRGPRNEVAVTAPPKNAGPVLDSVPVLEWVAELIVATVIDGVPTRLEAVAEFPEHADAVVARVAVAEFPEHDEAVVAVVASVAVAEFPEHDEAVVAVVASVAVAEFPEHADAVVAVVAVVAVAEFPEHDEAVVAVVALPKNPAAVTAPPKNADPVLERVPEFERVTEFKTPEMEALPTLEKFPKLDREVKMDTFDDIRELVKVKLEATCKTLEALEEPMKIEVLERDE